MPILNEEDRNLIVLASSIKGDIVCQKTKSRKCGYLIQPRLWFSNRIPQGVKSILESKGIEVKMQYSSVEEITKILNMITGLEDLSSNPHGLATLRLHYAQIQQPKTHDDVIRVLSILDG